MLEHQPIFRLIEGTLTAPNGQDIDDTLAGLTRIDPRRADDGEPCVACPESYEFALRLPKFNERLYIEDGPEHTCLDIFWAMNDASGKPILMVRDQHYTGENAMIAIPEDDTWHRLEPGGQLLRRFLVAAEARAQYPDGTVLILRNTATWSTVEVHSCTNPSRSPSETVADGTLEGFMPNRVITQIPIGTWGDEDVGWSSEVPFKSVAPTLAAGLSRELESAGMAEEAASTSTIIVEILMIATETGPAMVIVLFQGFQQRDYVRFMWREVHGEEMLTTFPRKLPRE